MIEEDSLKRKIREVAGRFMQEMRDLGVEKKELPGLIESLIKEEKK